MKLGSYSSRGLVFCAAALLGVCALGALPLPTFLTGGASASVSGEENRSVLEIAVDYFGQWVAQPTNPPPGRGETAIRRKPQRSSSDSTFVGESKTSGRGNAANQGTLFASWSLLPEVAPALLANRQESALAWSGGGTCPQPNAGGDLIVDESNVPSNSPYSVSADEEHDNVIVGNTANGVLNQGGGTLTTSDSLLIGNMAGSSGTYNLGNGNLVAQNITVGQSGTGVLNLFGGTLTVDGNLVIAANPGSSGTLNLTYFYNPPDEFSFGTLVTTGITAGSGTATVRFDGGVLQALADNPNFLAGTPGIVNGGFYIDTNGFNVRINQPLLTDPALGGAIDGGLSKNGAGTLTLTGTNTYNGGTEINAGTLVLSGSGSITTDPASLLIISGGDLILNDSANFSTGIVYLANGDSGSITQNGGAFSTNGAVLYVGSFADGTYDLNGGTLTVGQVLNLSSMGTFNFNGGTLQAAGDSSNFLRVPHTYIQAGGAVVDSNAFNIAISQSLLHDPALAGTDGGLTKNGAGTLTLKGGNTYTGSTTVNGGTLVLDTNATVTGGAAAALSLADATSVILRTGSSLSVNGVSGGGSQSALYFDGGKLIATANNASFISGVGSVYVAGGGAVIDSHGFGITSQAFRHDPAAGNADGGLKKLGNGTLTLTGASNYLGETLIEAGGLALGNGASITTAPASSFTLRNASLTLGNGASISTGALFVGSSGSGSVTQNGGSLATNNQPVYIGYAGSGVYHLDGGTLTVSNLATSGDVGGSAFHFNGGVLRAASDNTDFVRVTNAYVQTGGAIIDSNGHNISMVRPLAHDPTLGGNPDGGLTKNGTGTLTLTNVSDYTGPTIINGGALVLAGPSPIRPSPGHPTPNQTLTDTTSITVNAGGTLLVAADYQIGRNGAYTTAMILNAQSGPGSGATVAFDTRSYSQSLGALTLSSTSVIDLGVDIGNGVTNLHFSDSSANTWSGTLAIWNWSGNPVTGGGLDQLFFGDNIGGVTLVQLTQIRFYSDAGSTLLGPAGYASSFNGEIVPEGFVPVPEPMTFVAGALLLGVLLWHERRRLALPVYLIRRSLR